MALNLSVGQGTLEISNGATELTGQSLKLSGSYAQLEADLATLHYQASASAGSVSLSVNVWNQGGVSITHSLGITII
jgi:hypothetical protein